MNNQPLLSICIPTYNREDALSLCVESILREATNSQDIEIVISDNASTDRTRELVEEYCTKYSNVKYFRNEINVGPNANICRALQLGTGVFLKLCNDYSVFTPGSVTYLIDVVKNNMDVKPVLLFSNSFAELSPKIYKSYDELLISHKWELSWMGMYGYWKEDFSSFENPMARIDTMFQQVDWLIRSFNKRKIIKDYYRQITQRVGFNQKQGGYNFIEVHSHNYFIQFKELVDDGLLGTNSLEIAQKDVLVQLASWVIKLKLDNGKEFSYDFDGSFRILKREFGTYGWFYPCLFKGMLIGILNNIKKKL